jgi:hypothetical protein
MGVQIPDTPDFGTPVPRATTGVQSYGITQPIQQDVAAWTYAANSAKAAADSDAAVMKENAAAVEKWSLSIDTTQAQDALNQLRGQRQELTSGENGFMRVQGGKVLEKKDGVTIYEVFPQKLQSSVDELGGKLQSPRARKMFQEAAAAELLAYKSEVARHGLNQTEKYQGEVYKDTAATLTNRALLSADDPKALETVVSSLERATLARADQLGIPGEAMARGVVSDVYKAVIEGALASGDGQKALNNFERYKGKLTGEAVTALQGRLKSTAIDVEGDDLIRGYTGMPIPDAVKRYDPLIQKAAASEGVKPALVYGVIAQESQGNPSAVSSAGARGLTQLMPGTAKDLGVTDPHNPEQAIPGGVRYLKQQLVKYDGNERLALMAYNWGPGAVDKWLKEGSDPDKVPAETRAYVKKVQGYAASVGGGKSDVKEAQLDILNRTDIPPAVKANAYAKMQKSSATYEAWKVAEIKGLDDKVEATLASVIASPESLKEGTFQAISEQYRALGRPDEATRYALLAPFETTLKQGLGSASEAQIDIFKKLFKGLPQQLVEALTSGSGKGRAEASSLGTEKFSQIKKSIETDGVKPGGVIAVAKEAIDHFVQAGKPEEARKVSDFMTSAMDADRVASGPSVEADQARAELIDYANKGQATAQELQTASLVGQILNRQKTLLSQDAFKNGATIYAKDVGQVPPIDFSNAENTWQALDIRSNQARRIRELSGNDTIPFTGEEIERFRGILDRGAPEQRASLLRTLGRALPADMMLGTALALSGKKSGGGDDVSYAYAAALANYGSGNPAEAAVADRILSGASILQKGGEGSRKPASTADDWMTAMQTKIGNALALHTDGKVPAELAAAVKAHYVQSMWVAGKQGDKTNADVLNRSIDAVTGGIVNYRGQNVFAPFPGATTYDVESALQAVQPSDIPQNLQTQEGDQITAQSIKRNGRLVSVGSGVYAVRLPDPRSGGDLKPIFDPNTGKAFVLDLRPLIERTGATERKPNAPEYVTGVPSLAGRPPATE